MNYAILRVAKLKSKSQITGAFKHAFREVIPKNADKEKLKDNVYSNDFCLSTKEGHKHIAKILEGKTIRKNAVLGLDYFMGFSKEAYNKAKDKEEFIKTFFKKSKKFLIDKHGKQNICSFVLHMDERTPHLSAVVIPIDDKGKLNARHFIGGDMEKGKVSGRDKLRQMQTDYANEVQELGLMRGKPKELTGASHIIVNKVYRRMNETEAIEAPEIPKPASTWAGYTKKDIEKYSEKLTEIAKTNFAKAQMYDLMNEHSNAHNLMKERIFGSWNQKKDGKTIYYKDGPIEASAKEFVESYGKEREEKEKIKKQLTAEQNAFTALKAEVKKKEDKEAELEEKLRLLKAKYESEGKEKVIKLTEHEAIIAKMRKEQLEQYRTIPFKEILAYFPDKWSENKKDKNNIDTEKGRITLDDPKFFNHDLNKGGGGSIDLVMQLNDWSFKEAQGWFLANFKEGGAIVMGETERLLKTHSSGKEAQEAIEAKKYTPPIRDDRNWDKVYKYLTETRKLDADIVKGLHRGNRIYADIAGNVVFATENGATLRGISEGSTFKGSRGRKEQFAFSGANTNKHAIITESPIDAISAVKLGEYNTAFSTNGQSSIVEVIKRVQELNEKGYKITLGFDNDEAGKNMTNNILEGLKKAGLDISVEVKYPTLKDWNNDLVASLKPKVKTSFSSQEQQSRGFSR